MLLRTVRGSFYAIDHGTHCLLRGRKCRKLMQKACQVGSRRENFDILSQHEPRSFLRMFHDPAA